MNWSWRIWIWRSHEEVSGMNRVAIEKKVLSENDQIAARLRERARRARAHCR